MYNVDDVIQDALKPLFASRTFCDQTADVMAAEVTKEVGRALETICHVIIPAAPTDGLLISMAMRYDHAFGIDLRNDGLFNCGYTPAQRVSMLGTMRQLHEEVAGAGFYQPEREAWYKRIANLGTPGQNEQKTIAVPTTE